MNDKDSQMLAEAYAQTMHTRLPLDSKVMSWGFGAAPVPCIIVAYKEGGYIVQPINSPSAACFQPAGNIEVPASEEEFQRLNQDYKSNKI